MPKIRAEQYTKTLRALNRILHEEVPAIQKNKLANRVAQWIGGIRAVKEIAAELGCPVGMNAHNWLWEYIRGNVTAELLHTSRGRGLRMSPKPLAVTRAGRRACAVLESKPVQGAVPRLPRLPRLPRTRALGFYESPRWRTLRFMIIECYGRECMACGRRDGEMHVDHIEPRSKAPGRELDPWNMQVLCKDCNLGKVNFSERDYRTAEQKAVLALSYASIIENMETAARIAR